MTDILVPKSSKRFRCIDCDYYASRKSQYDRHLLTAKHQNTDKILTNTDVLELKSSESSIISNKFNCSCGKEYKHRQSLFSHKKKCGVDIDKDAVRAEERAEIKEQANGKNN